MAKILEFKLEKLQELAENCGCADLAIIDPEDGSYEGEDLEYDSDEWIEGDGIEVDDEFGEFNGNYDEDLADVIEFSDAEEDRGLLKQKIMQAISDVLGETANSDKLHGGKADYVPDYKFNKKELRKGIRHELEHSDDSDIAKETAEDHMMEDPKYYTHLKKYMGQFEKKNKKKIKEAVDQTIQQNKQFKTFGELKGAINSIITKKRVGAAAGQGVQLGVDFAIDALGSVIPGVSLAKTAFDFFKSVYSATDDKKTDTWLDKLNVDDQFSAIVDDTIENAFLKELTNVIMSKRDDEVIPTNFNINVELQTYLKKTYKQRTVAFQK